MPENSLYNTLVATYETDHSKEELRKRYPTWWAGFGEFLITENVQESAFDADGQWAMAPKCVESRKKGKTAYTFFKEREEVRVQAGSADPFPVNQYNLKCKELNRRWSTCKASRNEEHRVCLALEKAYKVEQAVRT